MSDDNGTAAAPDVGLSERQLLQVASGICLGYSDKWIATRFNMTVAVVKALKAQDDFQTYLDEAEIEHQVQMRGRQRRVARLTLKALERMLQADDVIIVTLGIEKVIRLTKQGFLVPFKDDEADAMPADPAKAQRAPASVKDKIAQLRGGA
jgi:hypothetical protein